MSVNILTQSRANTFANSAFSADETAISAFSVPHRRRHGEEEREGRKGVGCVCVCVWGGDQKVKTLPADGNLSSNTHLILSGDPDPNH